LSDFLRNPVRYKSESVSDLIGMRIENRKVQSSPVKRDVKLTQRVGLGVGGNAERNTPAMQLTEKFSRTLGQTQRAANLHLQKEKVSQRGWRQAAEAGNHLHHDGRPQDLRPLNAAGPRIRVLAGDDLSRAHRKLSPSDLRPLAEHLLEKRLPKGVGLGWRRTDVEERRIDVTDDRPDLHG
jgi:hypothetical protein